MRSQERGHFDAPLGLSNTPRLGEEGRHIDASPDICYDEAPVLPAGTGLRALTKKRTTVRDGFYIIGLGLALSLPLWGLANAGSPKVHKHSHREHHRAHPTTRPHKPDKDKAPKAHDDDKDEHRHARPAPHRTHRPKPHRPKPHKSKPHKSKPHKSRKDSSSKDHGHRHQDHAGPLHAKQRAKRAVKGWLGASLLSSAMFPFLWDEPGSRGAGQPLPFEQTGLATWMSLSGRLLWHKEWELAITSRFLLEAGLPSYSYLGAPSRQPLNEGFPDLQWGGANQDSFRLWMRELRLSGRWRWLELGLEWTHEAGHPLHSHTDAGHMLREWTFSSHSFGEIHPIAGRHLQLSILGTLELARGHDHHDHHGHHGHHGHHDHHGHKGHRLQSRLTLSSDLTRESERVYVGMVELLYEGSPFRWTGKGLHTHVTARAAAMSRPTQAALIARGELRGPVWGYALALEQEAFHLSHKQMRFGGTVKASWNETRQSETGPNLSGAVRLWRTFSLQVDLSFFFWRDHFLWLSAIWTRNGLARFPLGSDGLSEWREEDIVGVELLYGNRTFATGLRCIHDGLRSFCGVVFEVKGSWKKPS